MVGVSTIQEWTADTESLDRRLGEPSQLRFPDEWTLSTSWQRAQTEIDPDSSPDASFSTPADLAVIAVK